MNTATADAPGRVNLLGEHTDYNDGFVLPTAIPQRTLVTLRVADRAGFHVRSHDLGESTSFTLAAPPQGGFARYVYGCLREVADTGAAVPPLDIELRSDVPIGMGLSSSAALEVAMLRALRQLLALPLDDVALAQMAQQAELRHAGVPCGLMDQLASSLADGQHMLFIDTRTLERRLLPLPAHSEIAVLDSGLPRTLAASAYGQRRAECEDAAARLGARALRDVTDTAALRDLPEPLGRRARHVVLENARVLRAAAGVDAATFGALMNASHASLRDDFEVSVPALDRLVALLQQEAEVHGARLTGAGFGGACVALCRPGSARGVAARVLAHYGDAGGAGRLLVPAAVG